MNKACAVVLHPEGAPLRLAVFTHPVAGLQIVKGTVRTGEPAERAAARELFEESGLETVSTLMLGSSDQIVAGETWHFVLCRAKPPIRDRWQHYCADDDGHLFQFHWIALDEAYLPEPFGAALAWIKGAL